MSLITQNPTSRYRVLDKPNLLPGKCAICGCVDRPVVDFGLSIRFYGVVFICFEDLTDLAVATLNMVPAQAIIDSGKEVFAVVTEFCERNDMVVVNGEQYRSVLDTLANLRNDLWDSRFLVPNEGAKNIREIDAISIESDSERELKDSSTTSSEGSTRVSADSSNEQFSFPFDF